MAKEDDKKAVEEVKPVEETKAVSKTVYIVKKEFLADKLYKKGSKIELPSVDKTENEKKIKEALISNKFI